MKPARTRADLALVEAGLAQSREKAQALILAGGVSLNGRRVEKSSERVDDPSMLAVAAPPPYVSRGGIKLAAALDAFAVDPTGLVCIDIGASTGGFTDALLQRGAARVYAVDVGYGQLADKVRHDPRVVVMERVNARLLEPDAFDPRPSLAVMDVSFISIRLILPALRGVMGNAGCAVTLIKPQFEAGRDKVGKGGVVRDESVRAEVLRGIEDFITSRGWKTSGTIESPIKGQAGNVEYLMDIRFA
ncbi:MAG: TlyA family RNA methyltransferase [Oscillospiraceae bacterium]|jgi:23S rRNA (cytidine1920-2'-O)/16S rRNA (cytidine1409-2'-O)-methyltransferase|nr:TlyA family RNA methyltransferase [Oscillospiraceae bacterium]